MIRIDRTPHPAPAALSSVDKNGLTELERARAFYLGGGNNPDGDENGGSFPFKAYGHDDVRAAVNAMSGFKCAYCESVYEGVHPVDVEHYRPKGRVLVSRAPRQEIEGYWWLAAEWSNLLASCIDCNRARQQESAEDSTTGVSGKADAFPLLNEADRATEEGGEVHEAPVLINPCESDPATYLDFQVRDNQIIVVPRRDDDGSVDYRRARGTIDLLGLNRQGLVNVRSERLKLARALVRVVDSLSRIRATLPPGQARDDLSATINMTLNDIKPYVKSTAPWSAALRTALEPDLKALGLSVPA